MTAPASRFATYEDLLALPARVVGEIIHGVLHSHPRPAPKHARAYSALGGELMGPYDRGYGGPGGWWILDEPEVHLAGNVLVPDLGGWRRERMTKLPDAAWFDLAPDWVCEILSPSTARLDRVEKLPLYAREGISHCWLIDPDLRTLEVFQNQDGKWLLLTVLQHDADVCQPPFNATTFALSGLWADQGNGNKGDAHLFVELKKTALASTRASYARLGYIRIDNDARTNSNRIGSTGSIRNGDNVDGWALLVKHDF